MTEAVRRIRDVILGIEPHDNLERRHKDEVLAWIDSGAQLFRISKPDNPPKHLVSYFVVFDQTKGKVLLIHHLNSGLLLPAGGHIEQNEDPRITVEREAVEELNLLASFDTPFGKDPLFVTVTQTIGQGVHTDVSLWYVIRGDSTQQYEYEAREMNGYSWLSLPQVLATDLAKLDPQLHRFIAKMQARP
jgi:8-oxo-dGTP pyrophosphatase MutT (NUDIX family)